MKTGSIRSMRSTLILLLDFCAVVACFSVAFQFRIGRYPDYQDFDLWLITSTFIAVLFVSGTYFRERTTSLPSLPIRTFWVSIAAGVACIGWLYVLGPSSFNEYFGRGVLPVGTLLCGIVTTLIRYLINRLYHRQEQEIEILYLGYSTSTEFFIEELNEHSEVRSVTLSSADQPSSEHPRLTWTNQQLSDLWRLKHWQLIIIDPNFNASTVETEALVELRLSGTPVLTLADFYERHWFMIPISGIDNNWFLRSQGFSMLDNLISRRIKRALDIFASISALVISFPLMILCGILIKCTSLGPVFYTQTRVGFEGKPFTIVKLRTMRHNAERSGAQWAVNNDPRVTFVGKILRKTRLDEIPQCWNVLKGEMSFVGPRPERPEFTKQLAEQIPHYELRHLVKPGITGWAQVIFPYGASVDDAAKKLQYELFYIKNQSFMLDLNILLRTTVTVFQRAGR